MDIAWRDIAFQPGTSLASAIAEQWQWLTHREDLAPFLCSMLGDVFACDASGAVHWLCCPGGHIDRIAQSRDEFDRITASAGEAREEWFGPGFVKRLHRANMRAQRGQCYMFKTLPIFPDCVYEPSNITIVPVDDVLIGLSEVMQLYEGLPDRKKRSLHLFE